MARAGAALGAARCSVRTTGAAAAYARRDARARLGGAVGAIVGFRLGP